MSITVHVDHESECLCDDIKLVVEKTHTKCAQIFTHGPKSLKLNNINVEKITGMVENLYVHSSYLFSFDNNEHAQEQFDFANKIGARGVVLHLKKEPPSYFANSLSKLNLGDCAAILEMKAIKHSSKYGYQQPEEINMLCEEMLKLNKKVWICLDTAHINAGRINLKTREDVKSYISKLKYPDMIRLLHLNGNQYDPMVKAGDKHIIPGLEGDFVFKDGDGDAEMAKWFLSRNCDVVVECKDALDYVNTLKTRVKV
jgi:endonuclease IV